MGEHAAPAAPGWDIFCRVVDNFGDVGVCWRLASGLAAQGLPVRLFIDDASALAWMAPNGAPGVQVLDWGRAAVPGETAGAVVIEAFGCDPPPAFVATMSARPRPPVWINLEYLSAESWVERSHGLPSPQPGGLRKWFFYPGFTAQTGGLLREPGLLAECAAFDRDAWLARLGMPRREGERVVSLFCYDNPAVPALLQRLADAPTLLLLTPGHAQRLATAARPGLRLAPLPWLAQPDFDRLLWACDLNFVRGEDSLVRAIWAGAPFVWQAYPQDDDVHAMKLQAMLGAMTDAAAGASAAVAGDAAAAVAADVAALWWAWNGLASAPGGPGCMEGPAPALPPWPEPARWQRASIAWRDRLAAQDDLVTQLLRFVAGKAPTAC
jgi:uncharacterized repeat protein (TIGR03837 family)